MCRLAVCSCKQSCSCFFTFISILTMKKAIHGFLCMSMAWCTAWQALGCWICVLPWNINLYLVLIWNKTEGFDKRKIFTLIFFSYKIKTDLFRTLNCIIKLIPSRLCNCKRCAKFESCAIWQAAWPRFTRQMISIFWRFIEAFVGLFIRKTKHSCLY